MSGIMRFFAALRMTDLYQERCGISGVPCETAKERVK